MSILITLTIWISGLVESQIFDKFIHKLKLKTRIEVKLWDSKTSNEVYQLTNRFDWIVYNTRNINFLTQNYNCYILISSINSNMNMNMNYNEFMQINIL